jgi:hypothetical protein
MTEKIGLGVEDPLSAETRKERRALLGTSGLGILVVRTGLVPTKISALGIEFSTRDQRSFVVAVAVVVAYFFVAFLIYAVSDFIMWRDALHSTWRANLAEYDQKFDEYMAARKYREGRDRQYPYEKSHSRVLAASGPVSWLRFAFEFVAPILIALYAIIALGSYHPAPSQQTQEGTTRTTISTNSAGS